jgi:hypothetical protein
MTDPLQRPSGRALAALAAVIAALAVAVTFAVIEIRHDSNGDSLGGERSKVTALAGEYAVDFTSIDYHHMQDEAAAEAKNATSAFGAVYTATIKTFQPYYTQHTIVEKTTVQRSALSSINAKSAIALIALDAVTTQKGRPATDRLLRVRITLSKVNGRWLMSNLTTL